MSDEMTDEEIKAYANAPLTRIKCPGCGNMEVKPSPEPHVGTVLVCECGQMWRPQD